MKTSPNNLNLKNIHGDTQIIDLTNKNLFDTIQIIIKTSTANVCKNSAPVLKYKSNIPNIEGIIKDIPVLCSVEFV